MKFKSFLKTAVAFTLAVFLTFGSAYVLNAVASGNTPTGMSDATGNDATGNNQQPQGDKVQLDAPTDLAFSDYFDLTFTVVEGCSNYNYELYKDGELMDSGSWSVGEYEKGATVELCTSRYINESGTYKFRVKAEAYLDDDKLDSEWSDFSADTVYTKPEASVAIPTIKWSETETGTFEITFGEGTGAYVTSVYFAASGKEEDLMRFSSSWSCPKWQGYMNGGTTTSNILRDIQGHGAGLYAVSVKALSGDMTKFAHSEESAIIIYDTSKAMAAANAKLDEVLENMDAADFDANAAVEALVESLPIEDLQVAMQCDATVIAKVAKLEEKVAAQNNITVEAPKVSDAVKEELDVAKIKVTGAAFNTAPNTTVALSVAKPEKEVEVPSRYRKSTQIDIKLVADGTDIHELKVPVTVTIPAPEGFDLSQLVILHHKADGTVERIVPLKNNDGTVSFTVTEFSTFVIAEDPLAYIPEQEITDDGNGNVGGEEVDNSSSSSSDSTPAPAKVKVLKPVIHKVVVGDTLNKIAAKYGVTLQDILKWNPVIKNPNIIFKNQEIIVGYVEVEVDAVEAPKAEAVNPEYYTVVRGDTLFGIARKHKLTLGQLKALNPELFKQKYIFANQKVRIK